MALPNFKVGDLIRCKRKFNGFYALTNLNCFVKVVRKFDLKILGKSLSGNKRDIEVEILRFKKGGSIYKGYIGKKFDVYSFHFRKATKRDEAEFLLQEL